MTNQEIFDDLGEMGTLMMLFLEMATADGECSKEELETIFESAANFTDQNVEQFLRNAIRVAKTLSFEDRVSYLNVGLEFFSEKFSAEMKKSILHELAKIAHSDGTIHDNESSLYKMAVRRFTA
jgi:uncharacterized tellurite resistance protein B-like protein